MISCTYLVQALDLGMPKQGNYAPRRSAAPITAAEAEEVKRLFLHALQDLYTHDSRLIDTGVNERTITGRLAHYMQSYFKDYSVDVEYNRNGDRAKCLYPRDFKGLVKLSSELYGYKRKVSSVSGIEELTYPDIIVHSRGNNNGNMLVIEAKKQSSLGETPYEDLRKVAAFTATERRQGLPEYSYQLGICIVFEEDQVRYVTFRSGVPMPGYVEVWRSEIKGN